MRINVSYVLFDAKFVNLLHFASYVLFHVHSVTPWYYSRKPKVSYKSIKNGYLISLRT